MKNILTYVRVKSQMYPIDSMQNKRSTIEYFSLFRNKKRVNALESTLRSQQQIIKSYPSNYYLFTKHHCLPTLRRSQIYES